jgi:ATP-dependent DNA helicase RecG
MAISYAFAKEGYQSAIMVPTEILAYQHYENFKRFLELLGVKVGLLTSSVKTAQRRSLLRHIKEANIQVVVGTHALIQEGVSFKSLGFAVVDEQHRFGVLQRKRLLEKSEEFFPHLLVMSATPIPRTLALSLYGDLDLSIIDQMPAGRKPVITRLFFESEMEKVLKLVREELQKGHKAYVIYPVIEDSPKLELKSAVKGWGHSCFHNGGGGGSGCAKCDGYGDRICPSFWAFSASSAEGKGGQVPASVLLFPCGSRPDAIRPRWLEKAEGFSAN